MRAVDIIIKKREKGQLTAQEIDFFVHGFTNGDIPDYQASAFAMAVLLNGMTPFETLSLIHIYPILIDHQSHNLQFGGCL